MPRQPLAPEDLLRISERCAELLTADGAGEPSVAVLADAAGLSERTFYRYFPTKADCLRPLFDEGLHAFVRVLETQPSDAGLPAAVRAAFSATFPDEGEQRSRAIMKAVFRDPALRRVWFEASWETARLIRPAVARQLQQPEESIAVTVGCGQAVLHVIGGIVHLVSDGSHPSELTAELSELIFPSGTGPTAA
ncbi:MULTISPECIES: TetR family transcriptional regulator [unclassified Microbacterium]|uniref:TetR family transcriptional regulator n=1 Tax=unclassified Microbacterium TaxID=2609290 RepID=UPI0012F783AD|nr:TetR family transcriptional regulator [Microbacterium sp. MAH-37]